MLIRPDMVWGNISKNTVVKQDTVYPVHFYPLGRNFHNRIVTACLCHLSKGFVKFVRFRGRVHGRSHMLSNDNTCGTDQTGLLSCRFQHSLYHMGRGSLSLGACNADQGKLLYRISKTGRRQQGQSPAGILYPQDRNLFLLLFIKLTGFKLHINGPFGHKDPCACL